MIKVVMDTNILVSSLLSKGPPAIIVDLIAGGKITPFYSGLILKEYSDVLSRDKFGFSILQVKRLIDDIVRTGMAIDDKPASKIAMANEDDRIFYDTAVEAGAYLVTGNTRHFPQDSFIVTAAQFLSFFHKS